MTTGISSSYIGRMMMGYVNGTSGKKVSETFSATPEEEAENASKRISRENSTVTAYKRRHPDRANHVDKQVNAGKNVLEACGANKVDTTKMTMTEYKQHIARVLDSIPFDASRMYDEESIHITDKGWEQMKNDPEYEAWIIGYNKENRSVHNPFAALGNGAGSMYCVEHFGASIEEHNGFSFSKTYGGTAAGARSLFEAKTKPDAMIKRAPQADSYPPKDYDIKQQQEKAHKKRRKQQEELDALFFQRRQTELWYEKKRQAQDLFAASAGISLESMPAGTMTQAAPAAASAAYESAAIIM